MRAEAATWLARLHADDKSPADECTFRIWLAADPCHAAAFEAVTEVWDVTGAAWTDAVAVPREAAPTTRRRALMAGVAGIAAAATGFAVWQTSYAGVYETATGEQKHVVLADGTQVFLDTDTRIHASYDSRTRFVSLERGRCNFNIMESDERPFVVDAAAKRILAGHTELDVRRDGDDVCVIMVQGSASVMDKNDRQRTELRRGDRLTANAGRILVDRPKLLPLLAWQTGQAVFDNDSLSDAVHEMNRYSVVKLEISDPSVARMRISGVYRVGDNAAFGRSIAALLPVTLEFANNQVRLTADRSRAKRT
jgi:transmembrane sensor